MRVAGLQVLVPSIGSIGKRATIAAINHFRKAGQTRTMGKDDIFPRRATRRPPRAGDPLPTVRWITWVEIFDTMLEKFAPLKAAV